MQIQLATVDEKNATSEHRLGFGRHGITQHKGQQRGTKHVSNLLSSAHLRVERWGFSSAEKNMAVFNVQCHVPSHLFDMLKLYIIILKRNLFESIWETSQLYCNLQKKPLMHNCVFFVVAIHINPSWFVSTYTFLTNSFFPCLWLS